MLVAVTAAAGVAAGVVIALLGVERARERPGIDAGAARLATMDGAIEAPIDPPPPAMRLPSEPTILLVGGGAPEGSQVSLEQDLALALLAFPFRPDRGPLVLFGGGPASPVLEMGAGEPAIADPLRQQLADFYDPRASREAVFRPTTLPVHDAASPERLTAVLREATSHDGPPLLVVVATHGAPGETPSDGALALWGGMLDAREVAGVLDAATSERPVRFVVAACFSGGFAELAFESADETKPATTRDRCGLFASTWDLEASGCDPDPDRAAQEGYLLHMLSALRGQRRDGQPMERDVADLDGDGAISLLEAHTCARISSHSLDVPTTTSERYLRSVAPEGRNGAAERRTPRGPADDAAPLLVEEETVIATLGAELGATTEAEAAGMLDALEREMEQGDAAVAEFEKIEAERFEALRLELALQLPTIDDPWRDDHAALIDENRALIALVLASEVGTEYEHAHAALDEAGRGLDALELRRARLLRLVRAFENKRLVTALAARGGPDFDRYARFLACERSLP